MYDRVAALCQQGQDISISLGGLVSQPGWPVSTARQAMGFFQGMYDVVQQVVDAVDEYLRDAPRPAAEAPSSRCLQKPTSAAYTISLASIGPASLIPALTAAQPHCVVSDRGAAGSLFSGLPHGPDNDRHKAGFVTAFMCSRLKQ